METVKLGVYVSDAKTLLAGRTSYSFMLIPESYNSDEYVFTGQLIEVEVTPELLNKCRDKVGEAIDDGINELRAKLHAAENAKKEFLALEYKD